MRIATVVLDIQTQALDAPYSYLVPDQEGEALPQALFTDADLGLGDPVLDELLAAGHTAQVGCAVLVPFGGRQAVGFVVELRDFARNGTGEWVSSEGAPLPADLDLAKLKPIDAVLSAPYFDENGAACALWMAHRYIAPLSSCVRLFAPPGCVPRMVNGRTGWRLEKPAVAPVDDRWVVAGPSLDQVRPRRGAVKQQAVLDAVRQGDVRLAELASEFGAVAAAVRALEEKEAVRVERRRRMRGMEPGQTAALAMDAPSSPRPCLTEGQRRALESIRAARAAEDGSVVLVDGVTGSGKTEVYLRAIEEALEQGRTAVVLVPEISLTPQTVARFRGRFGHTVAVLHSRMSQGERFDQWDFIRSGQARVVVGARSALFSPLANVGLIVIDEEHEGSYKQDSAPRYVARDVALWMARRNGSALVLGSATPSIESLHACKTDPRWTRVELPQRANGSPLPRIDVVDMAAEFGSGRRSMFSVELEKALREELSAGHKAVLLLNQRGFAKFLLCRDCGFVPECPQCSTSLTYHERGNFIICHHCGHTRPAPPVCPECSSPYLKKFGAGTQRVEDELAALVSTFPGPAGAAQIIRMDADTTSAKGSHQRLLEQFGRADAAVLLGTQMIAKGLDFKDVTLVGVINADTQLHLPDYRAAERTFDLIEQVAGRAGRAELPGRVIVQTYEAANPAIRAAATYDRDLFLGQELPKRRLLGYPPYVRLANVLVWGKEEEAVRTHAQDLAARLSQLVAQQGGEGWSCLPATPCVLAKLRGTYRWHVLVRCPARADVSQVLEPFFRQRPAHDRVNVAVDVDPVDLL
ncbi:MAG: primosomal protein N' [Eggerthellales bacterium]|nr:primosomal protein N' [Eggerthellales bacterium]